MGRNYEKVICTTINQVVALEKSTLLALIYVDVLSIHLKEHVLVYIFPGNKRFISVHCRSIMYQLFNIFVCSTVTYI
jgi:hypothetical protein